VLTRPRHRSVLWSARYPCRLTDPDSPPALTLTGSVSISADLAPSSPGSPGSTSAGANESPSNLTVPLPVPGPSQGFPGRDTGALLWYARHPCQVSDPDSPPALSLAGAFSISAEPGSTSPGIPDRLQWARTNRLLTSRSHFRPQAHLGVYPAETPGRDCGLHATPVRFRYPTVRRLFRAPVAFSIAAETWLHLAKHSWFDSLRARTNRLLTSRSRLGSQVHLGDYSAETPGRCYGMHATPAGFRIPTARRLFRSPVAFSISAETWLHPHQALLIDFRWARTNRLLTSRSHSSVPGLPRSLPGRDTGACCGLHVTPVRFRFPPDYRSASPARQASLGRRSAAG